MTAAKPSPAPAEGAPPAEDSPFRMPEAAREEARRYGRLQLWCGLADRAIDLLFLGLTAFFVAAPLEAYLAGLGPLRGDWPRLAALILVVYLLHEIVSLPLAVYSGYWLEHRFGLSRLTFARWLRRHVARYALAVAIGLPLFLGLYAVIWAFGPWWWLVAAALFFLVSIVAGQLAPVLIFPLFYRIEPIDYPEITARIGRLTEGTGLTVKGVYRIALSEETVKANAALAGLGRTRRVLLGDTLLDRFTPDEIEVILAHEIGHHVHRHIGKLIVFGGVMSGLGFWLCDRLLSLWAGLGAMQGGRLPVSSLPLVMFLLTLLSALFEPLYNIVSRHFEREADRFALSRSGHRMAYRTMFAKLAMQNKDDPDPHPVEVFLFHSHPSLRERVALADGECTAAQS